jgi:hypothetical protein
MTKPLHIAVGTPMHGGLCTSAFKSSVMALDRALRKDGSRLSHIDWGNESLIVRARDAIAWHFLNRPELADASYLLFVDADEGFRVEDIARMVAAAKPVIVAPVPMKQIDWGRVARAAQAGVPAAELNRYTGFFNVVHLPGPRAVTLDEPFEIKWGGSGLMLIERSVLEALAPLTPTYVNDMPGEAMPRGALVHNFFPAVIEPDEQGRGHLLSEDFAFCAAWRRAGGSVWCAPWARVEHMGTYVFAGSYADSLRLDHELSRKASN